MALLFYDGFDWAGSETDVYRKWNGVSDLSSVGTSYGRFGTKGAFLSNGTQSLTHIFNATKTTIYCGFALKRSYVPQYNSSYPMLEFKNNTTTHVKVYFKDYTIVSFYNGSGTQIGTDITIPNIYNKWLYYEFKVIISDTVGEIIFRINGVEYYNGTNLDTRNGTPTDIDNIKFRAIYNSTFYVTYYDDIYIDDSQFHGDVRVRTIYPDANGSENDFTPSANSNYQNVDDPGDPDDDTTYNSANTVGDRDLYGVTSPTLATVKAVAVNNMVRKDDAGTRKIKNVCRSGGSNYLGSEFELDSQYFMPQSIWELDPQDSAAWTKAKIDAAEFGLEITA